MLSLPGHTGIRRTIEAVIRPRIDVQLDRYSGAAQSIRIGQIFFEEEIETADRNVGWRQARHIRRRGAPVRTLTRRKLCPSIGKLLGKPASLSRLVPRHN